MLLCGSGYFGDVIDEVVISNEALSEKDIQDIMCTTTSGGKLIFHTDYSSKTDFGLRLVWQRSFSHIGIRKSVQEVGKQYSIIPVLSVMHS